MTRGHQFYSWNGLPVRIEWFDGPCDVTAITAPAEHPNGHVPEDERHALVSLLVTNGRYGWWASEMAVHKYADRIGPAGDGTGVGIK